MSPMGWKTPQRCSPRGACVKRHRDIYMLNVFNELQDYVHKLQLMNG